MKDLIEKLKESISGEVKSDPVTRRVYSVDASIYEVEPLCVVLPKNRADVVKTVMLAGEHGVSLVPRGAATGITGGCIGRGVVVDLSKYMNQVISVDWEKEQVVCEPGVVQDQLNGVLAEKGFRLGPDTSTGNRATVGGMLANNAAGARSLKYGRMVDAILETELVLADGEVVRFSDGVRSQGRAADIYRAVEGIKKDFKEEIVKRFPDIPRRVSGYNLDELAKGDAINISKLVAGSEGTLGIVTEMVLRIVPATRATGLCVVHFEDMIEGMRHLEEMLAFRPISVEMIDHHIIEMGRLSPSVRNQLGWLKGSPEAVFCLEVEEEDRERVEIRLREVVGELKARGIGDAHVLLSDPGEMSHVWNVRKAGLGLLLSKRSYSRAVAFIEDISVHPLKLASFMSDYQTYMKSIGKESGIYGHVGSGCMHIRPYMDMRKEEELKLMERIMRDVTQMLLRHGGTLSGEHGDGLVRSWLNKTLYGERLYEAFIRLKEAFDPENRMNPGKVVHPEPFRMNMRMDSAVKINEVDTFLDFSEEGGMALAADMCNGNGQCRKLEGTMCPSFQASGDEYHTTRARAQTLRGIITGRLPSESMTGEGLRDVLDLCIECKGCRKECPSQVDMAKMKAEFLFQYQEKHGYGLRDRLFAFIGAFNRISSPVAVLANAVGRNIIAKKMLSMLGVASQRELPALARQRFSWWAKKHGVPYPKRKQVVLFNDTFTEFNEPQVGVAAVEVLEGLGYSVIIPKWQCCGRTLISKGFLRQAKKYAADLVNMLRSYAEQGIPIIGLEPSCILTIKDDFRGLLGYKDNDLNRIISCCYTLDEFLERDLENGTLPLPFKDEPRRFKLHGHCHQKALSGTASMLRVLKAIPRSTAEEIPTGCCGMAGSFGYEKEHYDFSLKIAALQLIPALEKMSDDVTLVANGFSCRHQIQHISPHKPLHLAEALRNSLE